MAEQQLISKIAVDKHDRKLGKIIKIEQIPDKKTKINKPQALVLVKNFLRKDVVILVEIEKQIKVDDFHVWFDILKEDFDQEVRETRALIRLYGGHE